MFRRITCTTLALALLMTIVTPVLWAQTGPSERGVITDPNGQPSSTSTTFSSTDLASSSTDETVSSLRPATPAPHLAQAAARLDLFMVLLPQFLAQALGI